MKKFITVILLLSLVLCSTVALAVGNEEEAVSHDCEENEILMEIEEAEDEEDTFEDDIIIEETELEIAYTDDGTALEVAGDIGDYYVFEVEEIDGFELAAACKHSYIKTYSSINDTQHQIKNTCSKCGKSKTSKASHKANKNQTYSQKDDNYHNVVSVCKDCNGTFTKQAKHAFSNGKCKYCGYINDNKCKHSSTTTSYQANNASTHYLIRACKSCGAVKTKQEVNHSGGKIISATAIDSSKHNIVKNCTKCKQNYTITGSHNYSSGKCKVCGYQISPKDINVKEAAKKLPKVTPTPRPSTTSASRDGEGHCGKNLFTGKSKDNNGSKRIYSNCPKCGASGSDSSFVKSEKVWTSPAIVTYHQKVKCNNCPKQYYNYCESKSIKLIK